MNLFDSLENANKQIPLAEILRPKTLDEYLGQNQIVGENAAFINLLKSNRLFSCIFWGPPGAGKTTLARLIASNTSSDFIELSAVNSGIKDIKECVEKSKENLRYNKKTILFIDEIHRYSKTQQDALLPYLENGTFYLIGSTTENPSFQVVPALISRVQVLMLKPLDDENIVSIVEKGFKYLSDKHGIITLKQEVIDFIVRYASGDARLALNLVENSYFAADYKDKKRNLTLEILESLAQEKRIRYSRQEHYDMASAFQKSMRGSDKNAAIYWLAKMISGGEDPRFIARRLIVCAAEDVGLADPNALSVAVNAYKAVELLGLPEGRIPLALAVAYVCDAPKSNSAICAIDAALGDIASGKDYQPPMHLRDAHYKDAQKYGFGKGYVYTHAKPDVYQQFLPDELFDKKYFN
ncbi:MAG: replication-associated recombination protein A [Clostridium sp.]|nr:replication-associated recombination protein A [Clostridium sp.]